MKNRERAMQILKTRLFDLELQKQQAEIAARRKSQVPTASCAAPGWDDATPQQNVLPGFGLPPYRLALVQVGTGSRSEKIKTYNYKDSRVSDHRSKSNFALDGVLAGDLDDCIDTMVVLDQQEQLQVGVACLQLLSLARSSCAVLGHCLGKRQICGAGVDAGARRGAGDCLVTCRHDQIAYVPTKTLQFSPDLSDCPMITLAASI